MMKKLYLISLLSLILSACSTVKYVEVPIPEVHVEYRDRVSIDTIIRNDSTIIREKGDTVFLEKFKYVYKTKELRDTVNITDTVTVVKKVEVTKEVNRIRTWQYILMVLGFTFIGTGIYKLIKLFKR